MTVDTPFPGRPATPFWSPRGLVSMGGLGDDATTIATAALQDATTAFVSTQQPACPTGYVFNSAVGACQMSSVTGSSGGGGILILLVLAFVFMQGGH